MDDLTAAIAALNSGDALTQNEGVEKAVRIGSAAVPHLLALIEGGGLNRAQVIYALSKLDDRRAVPAFAAALHDKDERVRAYAAQGLFRLRDPHALTALLQTIDDAPDELHLDITPSVLSLGEMGLRTVPALLDLLMADHEITRLHAQRALERILLQRFGASQGASSSSMAEKRMRSEWVANGNYDYAASAVNRKASVEKLRQWLMQAEE